MVTHIKNMTKIQQLAYWKKTCTKYRSTLKSKIPLLIRVAKTRSIKHSWDFDLTKEWLKEKLANECCEVSGEKFNCQVNEFDTHFNPYAPSIDRIDSSKGYTKDNCRVVLACVNMGIGEWGLDIYLDVAEKVIVHQKKCN
jgi:hypothetical protein